MRLTAAKESSTQLQLCIDDALVDMAESIQQVVQEMEDEGLVEDEA